MNSPVDTKVDPGEIDDEFLESIPGIKQDLMDELSKVIVGQEQVLEHLLISLFCDAHSILVGVPGLAKTRMVRSLSEILDLEFNRIQFTPDLMPSDITGTDILQEGEDGREFVFRKGPVFTDILLADEINRTPPKTQSALLQAMQEREITAGGKTYQLSNPFFVLATQNPIEQEGTYPLPEAQLDRFMLYLYVDYPSSGEEADVVNMTTGTQENDLNSVLDRSKILEIQKAIRLVPADEALVDDVVDLVQMTRPDKGTIPDDVEEWVRWGAGPRASQYLVLAGKARALLNGESSVTLDHVRELAPPILRHRIVRSFSAESEDVDTDQIISRILEDWPSS
ncbi:MAG: AAA family ATPase [bacterium]